MTEANWTEARLVRLFSRYNRKFWSGRLRGWSVDMSPTIGLFGCCIKRTHQISVRIAAHDSDRQVRATLVHEMAHAATTVGHNARWRREMERLRRRGAPTSALDFLVPYKYRLIVTSFMDAAESGASWTEALSDLGEQYGLINWTGVSAGRRAGVVLREARRYFFIARRKAARKRKAGKV